MAILKPKCDKCGGFDFTIVPIDEKIVRILASDFYKSADWVGSCTLNIGALPEPTKRAICNSCGKEYLH